MYLRVFTLSPPPPPLPPPPPPIVCSRQVLGRSVSFLRGEWEHPRHAENRSAETCFTSAAEHQTQMEEFSS